MKMKKNHNRLTALNVPTAHKWMMMVVAFPLRPTKPPAIQAILNFKMEPASPSAQLTRK